MGNVRLKSNVRHSTKLRPAATFFVVAGLFFVLFFCFSHVEAIEIAPPPELQEPLSSADSLKISKEAEAFLDKGMEAWQSADIETAITNWKQAAASAEKLDHFDGKAPLLIAALDLLGVASDAQGDLGNALKYMLHGLEIRRMDAEIPADELAYAYNNIGAVYFALTDWEKAERYYDESQRLYLEAKLPVEAAWPMTNQGLSRLRNEHFREAIEIYENAEELVKKSGDPLLIASLYNNWGLAKIQAAEIAEGIELLEQVIAYEKAPSSQQQIAAANLGFAHLKAGDLQKAITWLDRAVLNEKKKLPFHRIAKIQLHRSEAFREMKDYENAQNAADNGLRLLLGIKENEAVEGKSVELPAYDPRTLVQLLSAKADALQQADQFDAAMPIYEEAFAAIDHLREGVQAHSSKLFLSGFVQPIYENALYNAWEIYQHDQAAFRPDLVFSIFQRNKSVLLQEELQLNDAMRSAQIPAYFRERLQTLKYMQQFLKQKVIAANRNENEEAETRYSAQLFTTSATIDSLEKVLAVEFPNLKKENSHFYLPTLQQAKSESVEQQTDYLSYFVGDSTVFGFFVGKNGGIEFAGLRQRSEIESQSMRFIRACTDWEWVIAWPDSAVQRFAHEGVELYQSLVQPLVKEGVALDFGKLRISPDGFLAKLPFEALVSQKPALDDGLSQYQWMIHSFEISYEWSPLKASQKNDAPQKYEQEGVLALAPMAGAGQAGKLRGLSAKSLPGTAKELEGIAANFEGQFLLGDSAEKSTFLALAPQYQMIHLAMHGYDDPENSALSRLDFAADKQLLAWEIGNLNLQADLVVLSACETGTGKIAKGEGVLSLGRSFISAGASSVVMSLWKLEDAASSEIMADFYAQMQKGLRKSAALRQAKLDYLSQADDFTAQPAFWAGLVLLGDQAPVVNAPFAFFGIRLSWILMALGIVILGALLLFFRRRSRQ